MRLRIARRDDLPLLRALFDAGNDAPYDLARVAEEKCFGRGMAGLPVTIVAELADGFAGSVTVCGSAIRLITVRRDARGRGIGSALLTAAETAIAGARIVLGHEAGNYFVPGLPASIDPTFFERRGFKRVGTAVDLAVDLRSIPDAADDVMRPTVAQRDEVTRFIASAFGAAWAFEAARAFENDPPSLFVARADGTIVGFSAHDANNRGLGFFGPAGVEPGQRGTGIGRALLSASLRDLRRLGYGRAIIPWAANTGFYERSCGASVAHTYIQLAKETVTEAGARQI